MPCGTCQCIGFSVVVRQEDNELIVMQSGSLLEICRHTIPAEKGLKVIKSDHRRDKRLEIEVLMLTVANQFNNPDAAKYWLGEIYKLKTRYMRDQLQVIQEVFALDSAIANDAMHFCNKNNIYSASDFKAIVQQHIKASRPQQESEVHILNPLSGYKLDKNVQPDKSQIEDYQRLFKG